MVWISYRLLQDAATFVARLLTRHSWIAYLGLLVILVVSVDMIWEGATELMAAM